MEVEMVISKTVKGTLWVHDLRYWDDQPPERAFRIHKAKNSILYQPGQYLTAVTLQELINTGWTVHVLPREV